MSVWNISEKNIWVLPDISISIDGKVSTLPLVDAVKKWKNTYEMVDELISDSSIKSEVFVSVNGNVTSPDEAKTISINDVRTVSISSEKEEIKPVKTLKDKLEEDGVDEKDIPVIHTDQHSEVKYHRHSGIVGLHKKTDNHRNPAAQRAHNKAIKKE